MNKTEQAAPWWSDEQAVFLSDLPRHLPRTAAGQRVHVSSGYRWRSAGLNGIRLRSFKIGSRLATTTEELTRFFEAQTQVGEDGLADNIGSSTTAALRGRGLW